MNRAQQAGMMLINAGGLDPLIWRAAKFGPYWWLAMLAGVVAWSTIEAATGSWWGGMITAVVGVWWMNPEYADRERVAEIWLRSLE